MPLTKDGLSAAIVAAQDAADPVQDTESGVSGAEIRKRSADALAEAIVNYLVANATVSVNVTGACPTGSVTGTGTGTIA